MTRALRPRLLWGIGALLALVLAGLASTAPFLFEPNRYAGVRSIEQDAVFRDPPTMARAWAMPVARLYRRLPYEYQHNASSCGPRAWRTSYIRLAVALASKRS